MRADDAAARPGGQSALAVGIFVALIATTLPVTRVIAPGLWIWAGLGLAALLLAVGAVLRRLGVPSLGATGIEVVLWVFAVTAIFFGDTAWMGFVPAPATIDAVGAAVASSVQEMTVGAAPLGASASLSFFVVAAIGALAIVLDHVVVTTRMPLLGAVALVAVAIVPTIAVPAPMDVFAFALLAAAVLFLLRTDTRTRTGRRAAASPATAVSASIIAVATVAVAVIVTPLLPAPDGSSPAAGGGSSGINPTLRLGDDLRRPNPVEVLQVRTSESRAPYLRAVTLSTFAGEVWRPDERESTPIGEGPGFGAVRTADGIGIVRADTFVDIRQLNTPYLPIPFPATAIGGLTGDWGVIADNRTVVGLGTATNGQSYEVITEAPQPSLEQIRAATARGADVDPQLREIPDETPAIISELAAQVTADTTNDYDAVAALQRWFRSGEFRYSLDAPVSDGFDGAGVDAIAQFLEVREGYCVHFASAFAVMARSLDIPTRIVIGYLPGMSTTDRVDDRPVYSVTSDLLHAWPEVYFEGIGWVPFEPTNSLGVPTLFSSSAGASPDQLDSSSPEASAAPSASTAPTERPDTPDTPQAGGTAAGGAGTAVLPIVGITALALLVLAAPAAVGAVRRRRQFAAAATGDATAAWRVAQDAAIDVGIPVPASASPRAFGARLVAAGAPPDATGVLVSAIEQASYAPASAPSDAPDQAGLAAAAIAVRAGLCATASVPNRVLATLAPRSLAIRPGSSAAGAGAEREPQRR